MDTMPAILPLTPLGKRIESALGERQRAALGGVMSSSALSRLMTDPDRSNRAGIYGLIAAELGRPTAQVLASISLLDGHHGILAQQLTAIAGALGVGVDELLPDPPDVTD